jgi:hypothetical protein
VSSGFPLCPPRKAPARSSGVPNLPAGFADTFTSRYVDTGELRQHVVTGRQGPPLLLVHGWPQTRYAWRLVMPALAQHFHVIALEKSRSDVIFENSLDDPGGRENPKEVHRDRDTETETAGVSGTSRSPWDGTR